MTASACPTPAQVVEHLKAQRLWKGSWLVAHASCADIKPGTLPTAAQAHCPACGHQFLAGEMGHPNNTDGAKTFNDYFSLLGPTRDPICSACAAIWNKTYLMNLSKCVVAEDGVYPFASNEDRSWFILNPPEPPFVIVASLAKQQHMYWRTPVAWNRDVFPMRVGTHVGTVRRALVGQALEVGRRALELSLAWKNEQAAAASISSAAASSKGKRKSGLPKPAKLTARESVHPYVRLDRDLESAHHGSVKFDVQQFLESGAAPRELNILSELNELEFWCLAAVANMKPDKMRSAPPDPIIKRPDRS